MLNFFAVFTVSPTSLNASLNDNATFTCSATAETVFWDIDGYTQASAYIIGRGIAENTTYSFTSGIFTSILTVPCTTLNNNTQLQCIAVAGGNFHTTEPSRLLIQGRSPFTNVLHFWTGCVSTDKYIFWLIYMYTNIGIGIGGYTGYDRQSELPFW